MAPTSTAVEQLARELVDRTRVFGALDTLENLKKGGRIGNAKALLATALSIKPIIEVADGVVEQHGKQRTRSKALAFLVDKVGLLPGPHREPRRAARRLDRTSTSSSPRSVPTRRGDRGRPDRTGHRRPRRPRHDRRRVPGAALTVDRAPTRRTTSPTLPEIRDRRN